MLIPFCLSSFVKAVINFGDSKTKISLPGSLSESVLDIAKKSNVKGRQGSYIFKVSPRDKAAVAGDIMVQQTSGGKPPTKPEKPKKDPTSEDKG